MNLTNNMQNAESVSFGNTSRAFSSKSDKELKKMYLLFLFMQKEILVKIGTFLLKIAIKFHFPVKFLIKKSLYEQFCGGETLDEVKNIYFRLSKYHIHTILDYGMEAGRTRESYEYAFKKIIETIEFAGAQPEKILTDFKLTALAPFSVLEKKQSGAPMNADEVEHLNELKKKLDRIGRLCFERNVQVMIDAEESWIQDAIDSLTYELMKKYNKNQVLIYNTIQFYRKDGVKLMKDAHAQSVKDNFKLGLKMVRGAYMEKERKRASELSYNCPVFDTKTETDAAFNSALKYVVKNLDRIAICCGSHNEQSTKLLAGLMHDAGIATKDRRILFAQLYGMSDNITYNLALAGYNVAKYVPYGPVKDVIPYLLRRAEENKAIAGQTGRELGMIKREMVRRRQKS